MRPDDVFIEAQSLEVVRTAMGLPLHEELVQLRRLHAGARHHGMRLSAVVGLVVEQVHQHPIDPVRLYVGSAVHVDGLPQRGGLESVAECDESRVDGTLFARQVGQARTWDILLGGTEAEPTGLQSVHVVPVDDQDVVHGRLKRRKEADSRGGELLFGERFT